jgi:hypothetical protein
MKETLRRHKELDAEYQEDALSKGYQQLPSTNTPLFNPDTIQERRATIKELETETYAQSGTIRRDFHAARYSQGSTSIGYPVQAGKVHQGRG